jgi:putative tricarboxylic transport membrane protein
LSYIPILIGLFGLAEVFVVLSEPIPYVMPQKIGKIFPPLSLIIKYGKSIIRSIFVGIITGVMPGAGADVACWFAYGLGERISKKKFSRGDLEGVICAETADKANLGGALLPTLVLGIPGSAPAAALLAALTLHGIVVGPTIDVKHPGFLNFIYGTLIVANIALYVLAFGLIKPSIRLFSLPREILLPIIVAICVAGSFVEELAMFDIYLVFGFGLLGYVMRRVGFPTGPMVLGVILGPLLDENFRRAMVSLKQETIWQILYGRPIGTIIIGIVILTFISGILTTRKKTEA